MNSGAAEESVPVLRLRRDVSLGPLGLEHAANMYRWMCDPEVRLNLGVRSEPSEARTHEWLTNALASPTIRAFAITVQGEHIGNVILDRVDTYTSTARISAYVGGSGDRRSGVGRTATYLGMARGFQEVGLNKIWSTVHCHNYPAMNTLMKLGFVVEGVLRDEFVLDGRRLDAFYVGILRRDFARLRADWVE